MQANITYLALIAALFMSACTSSTHYPETRRDDAASTNFFGTKVADPYRWLEDETSAETKAWVEAQNKITFGYLNSLSQRDTLRNRLKEVWNYPKYSAPNREGEFFFFYKNDGLQPQSVLYRQRGLDGSPEVFIDPNTFANDGTVALSTFSISHDHRYAVYGKSEGGSDWQTFFVKEVATGKDLSDRIEWVKFSGASWYKDGFFYTRFPQPEKGKELSSSNENAKLYYHKIGTPQSADQLIYEDPKHPLKGVYGGVTPDERYLLLTFSEGASDNSAIWYKDLKTNSAILPLVDNYDNSHDFIATEGDKLLFITNLGAPRKRIVLVDPRNPAPDQWKEIVPQHPAGVLQNASYVGGKLFLTYLIDVTNRVFAYDLSGKQLFEVKLPGLGIVEGFGGEKEDTEIFYTFTSFIYPPTIYRYNVAANTSEIFRKSEVKFNPDDYVTEQVMYPSKDGTKVPLFITYKKGLKKDGQNPAMLYGYGGFNISVLPAFSVARIPFLENGGVYASACLRGGSEYGEDWHQAGMLGKKQNVFDDFIAAAEYLVKEGYTQPEKLAINGRSNGGLLVGAAMTQRPDLFACAIPGVGVLDMLRFHRFTIGHAWCVEYGCADSTKAEFENLHKYSPLHNLREGTRYPATLIMTADHDDRVVPAHSYKFAAALQHAHSGNNPVMIRIDTKAGHGAGRSTQQLIEENADMWAFIFQQLGVEMMKKTR